MRHYGMEGVLVATMALGTFLLAGSNNTQQPFVGYDYVRPVRRFLPANTSPYEDITNRSVYDSAPADLFIPEPTGTPEEPNAFSHFFSKSEPNLGATPDIFGPQQMNSQ